MKFVLIWAPNQAQASSETVPPLKAPEMEQARIDWPRRVAQVEHQVAVILANIERPVRGVAGSTLEVAHLAAQARAAIVLLVLSIRHTLLEAAAVASAAVTEAAEQQERAFVVARAYMIPSKSVEEVA